jgi:spindle assembly abnormal protein 6
MHMFEQSPAPISVPKVVEHSPAHNQSIDVPVAIRSTTQAEKRSILRLTISMMVSSSGSKLAIELTDENDPQVYYIFECGEAEFHALKNEQQIIVDFQKFPSSILDLLELCCKEAHKFGCVLHCDPTSRDALLNIVETNVFKELTHLSLKFSRGTDGEIKDYLGVKLKTV